MIDGHSKNDQASIMDTFKNILKGFIRQRPFCTGLSSGNQVDGLPLGLHESNEDAVTASCILPGRAPNHIY